MKRKGEIHVDWIISVALFTLYTIGLIAFMRPGVYQTDTSDMLINLLEEKFREDVSVIVYRTPLMIEGSEISESGTYGIQIDFPFEGILANFDMKNNNWESVPFQITTAPSKKMTATLEFNKEEKNVFWLLQYPGVIYDPVIPRCDGECIVPLHTWGSREEIEGLSKKNLRYVIGMNYDSLKQQWGFPGEFSIVASDMNGNILYSVNDNIPAGATVISKEIRKSAIDENYNREEIIVTLKAW